MSSLFNTFIVIMLLSISKQINPAALSFHESILSHSANHFSCVVNVNTRNKSNLFSRPSPS